MSRKVTSKGGYGIGSPYDLPGYEYDPINDSFTDTQTGKTFSKDTAGTVAFEANKAATIDASQYAAPVEITPSAGKDSMKKVTVTVNNIPEASDLEDNKAETIAVSAYSAPVEITPSGGKDGMKKVTVTLSDIPSGSGSSGDTMPGTWYQAPMDCAVFTKLPSSTNTVRTYASDIAAWTNQPLTDAGTYDILVHLNSDMIFALNNDSNTGDFESMQGQLVLFKNVPLIKEDDGCGDYIYKSYTDEDLDGSSNPAVMVRPDGNGKVPVPKTMSQGDYGIAFNLTI